MLLLATYFLFFTAFIFLQSTLSPWLQTVFGYGAFQTGLVFFFIGGISSISQAVLLPSLNKKFSQHNLFLFSISLFALSLTFLAFISSLPTFLVAISLVSFAFGNQFVIINTLISTSTPKEAQGSALGIAWTVAGLAQTITPIFATTTFTFGVSAGFVGLVFVFPAVIAILTVPLVLSFQKTSSNS